MPKKKDAKKRQNNKKSAGPRKTSTRKRSVQGKRPTRVMEPGENTSARIHQGVGPWRAQAEPEPAPRQFPENDAEYGEES
jgi:hypothetical protein